VVRCAEMLLIPVTSCWLLTYGHTLYSQRTHCREILFTQLYRPRATEFPMSVNFSVRRTVSELRGVKVAQFSDFGLFIIYKTPKKCFIVRSLQRGFRLFRVVVEGPKECLLIAGFSCNFGKGATDPRSWADFAYGKSLCIIHKNNVIKRRVGSGSNKAKEA